MLIILAEIMKWIIGLPVIIWLTYVFVKSVNEIVDQTKNRVIDYGYSTNPTK